MTISIQNFLVPSREIEFEYPLDEGIFVSLCYLSREEITKIRKQCVQTKFDRKTHKPVESLDEDKFLKMFTNSVIKGWRGLKLKHLEELLLVSLGDMDPEAEVPFTEENVLTLMRNSTQFDSWVSSMVDDLANFKKSSS